MTRVSISLQRGLDNFTLNMACLHIANRYANPKSHPYSNKVHGFLSQQAIQEILPIGITG